MAKGTDDAPPAPPESVALLLALAAGLCRANFEANLAPLALTARQGELLLALAETPTNQNTLARRFRIDRTTMVALVDDFESRGLLERLADPDDRRAYRLLLTKAGRATVRLVATRLRQAERDALAPLSDRQRTQLANALRAIVIAAG